MSWEAVKWAHEQNPGDPTMKYVLIAMCDFASKRTGKISAGAKEISDWCNHHDWRVVKNAQAKLEDAGFIVDTGERTGGNGRVPIYLPGYDQTRNKLEANKKQTRSKLGAPDAPSFIGKVVPIPEPGTLNHGDNRMNSPNSCSLSPSEERKKTRPAGNRPGNLDEVWAYIVDHKNDDRCLADLREYLLQCLEEEEADRQIGWWFNSNQRTDWKISGAYICDWKSHLLATFAGGHFPAQREEAKKK
jgi:hypothetical protein